MIIGFDAKRYFNNSTGLGFYSRTLVDSLCRFHPGHRYLLYTPYRKGEWKHEGMRLPDTGLGRFLHPLWRSRGITAQLRRDGVQVYHGLSHELPGGLHSAGIRSVVSMHDLIFMRYPELYPAVDRFFYEKKYKKAAFSADKVVAISRQTRDDLHTYFKLPLEKIQVIGQSCDPAFEQFSLWNNPDRTALPLLGGWNVPEKDYLIAVGSLTRRKNWNGLLDALHVLKKRGLDMPLVAVGSGKVETAQQLHEQAARQGLQVYWIDAFISSETLALLYRRAAALVYPSIFEGFGIPILEALSLGIPVVTTRGGCFEEVGGDAALYAEAGNTEELAAQIAQVLDSDTRATLSARMPARVEAFSAEKIAGEWMEVYGALV